MPWIAAKVNRNGYNLKKKKSLDEAERTCATHIIAHVANGK